MLRLCTMALIAAVVLLSVSCSVIDDDVVEVGVVRLYPVLPAMGLPVLGEDGVQLSVWNISSATVAFPDITSDLAEKGPCVHFQSYITLTAIEGECSRGASVAVYDTPIDALISFTTTLEISRIAVIDLPVGGDFDNDLVLNEEDTCPLIANGGDEQLELVTDNFGNEIGLACAFDSTGGEGEERFYFLDTEADGIPDIADNCPFHDNPLQENTSEHVPDGIGDACTEEATVTLDGQAAFDLDLDLTAISPQPFLQLLVLDFGDDISSWGCDWVAGTCVLDPATVSACLAISTLDAAAGCP